MTSLPLGILADRFGERTVLFGMGLGVFALSIFMAGLVLITPGTLTDLLGLFLLVPRGRAFVRKKLGDYFQRRVNAQNVTIVYRNPNGSG